jgi:threonine dehydratase
MFHIYRKDLEECHNRIKPHLHKTPVLTSQVLNNISGADLYFKCENFQRMGAFKMRGALNAILQLSDNQKRNGVVTHSSGNFAQALSLAAKCIGIKAYIVMPRTAPQTKKNAVANYDGIISECQPTLTARENAAREIVKTKKATFIHPSNDLNVILGQGTAGIELLEDCPHLEYILTPVGGGGLIAGTALAAKYFGRNCKIIGGEPYEADDAYHSLKTGKIEHNKTTNTLADGLKTELGSINFPIIHQHVNKIIRVTEKEIVYAMKLIWERMKIIIEPSSAVAYAAVLKKTNLFSNKKVGIILSGGSGHETV